MTEPPLPPSRFGAGYTVGAPAAGAGVPAPVAATPAPAMPVNRIAVIAFVTVLVFGPLAVPFALPLAVLARRQIGRTGHGGAGLATAALCIGAGYLVLGAVVAVLAVTVGTG
ncbi:hypothetical protein [Mycolicibacterium sp.]|uniref:hypothetical protein n=1 Tax=Mycolicibacterium sp. TaxID=2320850 RepID=UPI003D0D29A2